MCVRPDQRRHRRHRHCQQGRNQHRRCHFSRGCLPHYHAPLNLRNDPWPAVRAPLYLCRDAEDVSNAGARRHFGRRSVGDQLTLADHHQAVGERGGKVQIVRDGDGEYALAGQL